MSAGQRFWFTPKRRKVQCSNCDEIFDNDYASCHMTKHHPTLINAGKTPSTTLIKESSQPSVSSFFKKSMTEPVSFVISNHLFLWIPKKILILIVYAILSKDLHCD